MGSTDWEARYAADPDPFDVRTSWYERRKIQVVLASLTRERYAVAWDAACGTGDLAVELAQRCGSVLASDASTTAAQLAAELAWQQGISAVTTATHALPDPPPADDLDRPVDLVVLSEVLYYLPEQDRAATARTVLDLLAPGGEVVSVHWRHHPHDAHLSGADATAELHEALDAGGLTRAVHHDDADFVSAHWTRPGDAAEPGTEPGTEPPHAPTPEDATTEEDPR
ncbi:class I SAM-dependent methyltransferase [Arsenicicoccus dermatophilus]|uniref:class I SAM-dependent methyltransferase n=1 Tax=Arsenicicoccus dermatophilus TaxID=1076331 RepID=UPI001F4D0BBA|nr:class I SAM-dependent methyltransferase [Arsenicicoccus dermatophilus]MCH8611935.1 class I SAM-dependent methyltransferase [Arsenicicoccus dermatophilus]